MVRFGYACINTVLRAKNVYTNRTLRLATLKEKGVEYAKELGLKNIKDLIPIIKWNEENGIHFMRVSSEVFPFASETTYGYSLKYAEKELKEVGDLAKKLGHRLTTHPGQYNILCSPNPDVVARTIRDLTYHAEMLDLMGLGPDSVMIIHMGGTYGDKKAAMERFEKVFVTLPKAIKDRIVLENDEVGYSVEDLLPVCQKLSIPLVLDWHHDKLRPSSHPPQHYLADIDAIWKRRGIRTKQHYSESAKGHSNPRTHSDYILRLPPCAADMDLMIEAKMKEQTVLRICKKYGFAPDNNIAPATIQVTDTPEELAAPPVEMQGRGRKKHTWTKKTTTRKRKGGDEEVEEVEEEEIDDGKKKKKKKVSARKTIRPTKTTRKRKSSEEESDEDDGDDSDYGSKKKKGKATKKAKKEKKVVEEKVVEEKIVEKTTPKRTRKAKGIEQ